MSIRLLKCHFQRSRRGLHSTRSKGSKTLGLSISFSRAESVYVFMGFLPVYIFPIKEEMENKALERLLTAFSENLVPRRFL